jgi:hypothetical protein
MVHKPLWVGYRLLKSPQSTTIASRSCFPSQIRPIGLMSISYSINSNCYGVVGAASNFSNCWQAWNLFGVPYSFVIKGGRGTSLPCSQAALPHGVITHGEDFPIFIQTDNVILTCLAYLILKLITSICVIFFKESIRRLEFLTFTDWTSLSSFMTLSIGY